VAVRTVAERRATFTRANLLAELHRQFQGVRFASPEDRIAVVERAADPATAQSLLISAPELHHTPKRFLRADGTSRFRGKGHEIFTSPAGLVCCLTTQVWNVRGTDGSGYLRAVAICLQLARRGVDRAWPSRTGPPSYRREVGYRLEKLPGGPIDPLSASISGPQKAPSESPQRVSSG
jgi:hypothetical protein